MCLSFLNFLFYLLYRADLRMRNFNLLEYAPHWNETKKTRFTS